MNDKKTWEEQLPALLHSFADFVTDRDGMIDPIGSADFMEEVSEIASFIKKIEASSEAAAYRRGLNRAVEYIKDEGDDQYRDGVFLTDNQIKELVALPDEGLDNKSV